MNLITDMIKERYPVLHSIEVSIGIRKEHCVASDNDFWIELSSHRFATLLKELTVKELDGVKFCADLNIPYSIFNLGCVHKDSKKHFNKGNTDEVFDMFDNLQLAVNGLCHDQSDISDVERLLYNLRENYDRLDMGNAQTAILYNHIIIVGTPIVPDSGPAELEVIGTWRRENRAPLTLHDEDN